MPSYITKNNHDGDPYSWIVGSLDPSKLGVKIPYVKATQVNCTQQLVGKITTLELADLNKSPNFSIHISFSDKKQRTLYLHFLNDIMKFPLADMNKADKAQVSFNIPTHRTVEHIIPLFSAMNLIEAVPQNFMMYLSRFLGFNYLEAIEQAIVHELLQGCKEGPMQRPYFERACILAKAANSPEMFAIIATFCARTFLEPYALIAAFDGLELIKNDAMLVQQVSPETIDTLNFRAGIALKACDAETILGILNLYRSYLEEQADKVVHASLDALGMRLREDIDIHDGVIKLESEFKPVMVYTSRENTEGVEAVAEDFNKEAVEAQRLQLSLGLLIKITDIQSKYYEEAQSVLSNIFVRFSDASSHAQAQETIAILGGEQVSKTLVDIASKMKGLNQQIKEKERIIASKPDSNSVNEIITGYKIQIENLNEKIKKTDAELKASKAENTALVSKVDSLQQGHAEKLQANEHEKSALNNKVEDLSKQLFDSDEALATHKAALFRRETQVKVKTYSATNASIVANPLQQWMRRLNHKILNLNWKLLPVQIKR